MSRSSRFALLTLVAVLVLAPAAALHPVVSHLYVAGLGNIWIEFTHLPVVGFFAIALLSVFPATGFAMAILRAARGSKNLPLIRGKSEQVHLHGFQYRRFPSDAVVLFTAGIMQPAIFVSTGAERTLGAAGLRAALLHEEAHLCSQDVVWRLLLRAIGRSFTFIPQIRQVVEVETLRTECAADDYAISHGASRLDLFEAIVSASKLVGNPLLAGLTGSDTEFRLARIVDPEIPIPGRPTRGLLALAAAAAAPALAAHVVVFVAALGGTRVL